MTKTRLAAAVLAALLPVTAAYAQQAPAPAAKPAAPAAQKPATPAAQAGKTLYTQAQFDLLLRERMAQGQPDTPELRNAVREELNTRALLVQEAKKKGLDKKDELRTQMEWENTVRFGGKLAPPVLVLGDSTHRLDQWSRQARRLEISRTLILARPWAEVTSVLLHEMADLTARMSVGPFHGRPPAGHETHQGLGDRLRGRQEVRPRQASERLGKEVEVDEPAGVRHHGQALLRLPAGGARLRPQAPRHQDHAVRRLGRRRVRPRRLAGRRLRQPERRHHRPDRGVNPTA